MRPCASTGSTCICRLTTDNAWNLVLGSGFRGMLHGLDDPATGHVRARFLDALDAEGLNRLDVSTLSLPKSTSMQVRDVVPGRQWRRAWNRSGRATRPLCRGMMGGCAVATGLLDLGEHL